MKDLQLNNNHILFEYNKYGKPALSKKNNYFFNISHSTDIVVCITNYKVVGIDIEEVKPIDINSFRRIFSTEEFAYILKKETNMQGFYEIWTGKESFLKMLGKGLTVSLLSFSIKPQDFNTFTVKQPYLENDPFFKNYQIDDRYVICACSEDNNFPEELTEINFSKLIDCFVH
ncbi:4'-phosphopantetheinyl transferase superfamily protein [Bacillus cereus]|nr:4'-phosphopantetheinyl transferase superfamily protein [Bacillus cereus]MDA2307638.1 4'-phosphopantetheinyl transferase superfamily protein [Bacillus cereus]